MKVWTIPALAVCVLASALVVVPFLPGRQDLKGRFSLEARLTSSASGRVQVFYDDGTGFSEANSTLVPITGGAPEQIYRFALPPGQYRSMRFDPLDRDGTLTIGEVRVADPAGRSLREIPAGAFAPLNQIQSLTPVEGSLKVVITPGANDPQLLLRFDPPLKLDLPLDLPLDLWARWAGVVCAVLVLALFAVHRASARLGPAASRLVFAAAARPRAAIIIFAALAAAASSYPVIFLGRSYVSPNFGTILLYEQFPTLPGYASDRVSDPRGSDVGAIMWQHVPFSMIQHRAWREGELPLWNRYNSGGVPLLGQGQSMAGDPLHLLVVAANGAAWAWDLKYLLARWSLACGLGLIVLAVARHLPSALAVSLASVFVGFFVYRVNHPAFFSLCYAPWPLFCWLGLVQSPGARRTAAWLAGLMLANLALMSSGTVKEAYLLLVTLNFSGLCVLLSDRTPWPRRLGRLAAAAWAGVLFALITAPLWGSFLATLRVASTVYDSGNSYQIQPGLLLAAFDGALFRPLSSDSLVFNPSANFLILAGLIYFLATLRLHFANRAVLALALSTLVPLAFAFGLVPPAWIAGVPFLANVLHIDDSFSCALIVLWSVLAGAGFAMAARRLGCREGRGDLIISGLILFALVFAYFGFRQAMLRPLTGSGSVFSPRGEAHAPPLGPFVGNYLRVLLLAVVALGCLARRVLIRRQATSASVLAIALCVLALLWRQGQQAGVGFPDYVVHPAIRADFHAPSEAIELIRQAQGDGPSRTIGLENNFFPGWGAVYSLEGVSGPDALMNPYYRELTGALPLDRVWQWRLYLSAANAAAARPFLDFLNVRYYLDLPGRDGSILGSALKLERKADLDVYQSPTAWPRAFFTDQVVPEESLESLLRQIGHGDGRPFAAVPSEEMGSDSDLFSLQGNSADRLVVPATDYRLTEDSTSFEVEAPDSGLAVLAETYWPGYSHAEIDGHPARVLRVNHAFQGIVISTPGRHHITVRYRPRRFGLCLEGSALGGLLLLGSAAAVLRRARPGLV